MVAHYLGHALLVTPLYGDSQIKTHLGYRTLGARTRRGPQIGRGGGMHTASALCMLLFCIFPRISGRQGRSGHRLGDMFECGNCHLNMCASCMPLQSFTLQD